MAYNNICEGCAGETKCIEKDTLIVGCVDKGRWYQRCEKCDKVYELPDLSIVGYGPVDIMVCYTCAQKHFKNIEG